MVIECTECQTRFRMADDKLKPGGTKVRCTKCKQIFTVHPPAEETEAFPSPPNETAEQGGDALADGGWQEDSTGGELPFDDQPRADFAADQTSSEQQEDFTDSGFSSDYSFELEGDSPSGDEGFSLESSSGADAEETGDAFSFGDAGQDTPGGFEDDAQDISLGFSDQASPPFSTAFADEELEDTGALAFSAGSDDQDSPADAASFDFSLEAPDDFSWQGQQQATDDSPDEDDEDDEFDLSKMTFGDDDTPEETVSSRSAAPFAPPRSEVFAPPLPADGSQKEGMDEPFDVDYPPESPEHRPFPWAMLLLLPLLILGGGAGYFFWADGVLDLDRIMARFGGQQVQATPPGQVRLTDLQGGFVDHAQLGPLFVIHGKTVNDFQETRSAISVKGVLYNDAGKALLQQTAFAGNPLQEPVLRTLPLDKIEEHMNNQFGDSLSNLNIAPGKSIPFTIVFKNLPTDLAEFTVEVVDSKPVSR